MDNKKSNMGLIVAGVAAVLLIGGGLLVLNSNQNDNKAQENVAVVDEATTDKNMSSDIVVVASNTSALSTLVTAVKAASLIDTLKAAGPYTVFAPTNDAFAALPAGTLDNLLKPENLNQLKSILTYHVVSGKVLATDLKDGQEITTVQGGKIVVSVMDGKVSLTDAKGNKVMVEKADVNADNGVVHVIGGVLLPS
jgi:uncharacterized surface protein with fasciclin (FAS1) repeats